ncbi:MAG: formylglycine-generating enzyme family protein [Chlorobiaceae bacterium]|nr:formylglycine-generating enzyme family protein [Chlorobiaceae bacterium]
MPGISGGITHKESMEAQKRLTGGRSAPVKARSGRRGGVRVMAAVVVISFMIALNLLLQQFVRAEGVPDDFERIPAGEFWMGSPENEPERSGGETRHKVSISEFYLCRHEVTVGEFGKFIEATGYRTDAEMNGDSSNWRHGPKGLRGAQEQNHPVAQVSWNDAIAYCVWRSATEGRLYWLPTEAQWEYACRAGTLTPFNTGTNLRTDEANYNGDSPYNGNAKGVYRETTTPVCSFSPNRFGLYDMHGNAWEWCRDWCGERYYNECLSRGTVRDPQGSSGGSRRVLRGGGWRSGGARYCRSAYRDYDTPENRSGSVGFRLVFVP